jgi:hypothetical protein
MTKIRPSGFSLAVFAVLLVSGCAGTMSTVGQGANRSDAQMFPISAEAADKLLATAMAGEFAGSPISRVEFPNKGYQATIRFALDSHTIVAYMIPAKGRAASGEIVQGYAFEVSHSGTMPISGGGRAKSLFRRVVQDAMLVAQPLPLVSFGE